MENKFKEYAEMKILANDLDERIKSLAKELVSVVEQAPEMKVANEYGNFKVASKPIYTYSTKVQNMEATLKEEKFKEQEKGIAKKTESRYLTFKK